MGKYVLAYTNFFSEGHLPPPQSKSINSTDQIAVLGPKPPHAWYLETSAVYYSCDSVTGGIVATVSAESPPHVDAFGNTVNEKAGGLRVHFITSCDILSVSCFLLLKNTVGVIWVMGS